MSQGLIVTTDVASLIPSGIDNVELLNVNFAPADAFHMGVF